MVNLLSETTEELKSARKTPDDIAYIGSRSGRYQCSWDDFCRIANVEYDAGYGALEVATDLIIVFSDGSWLERAEYDGSEWWDFKSTPTPQCDDPQPIMRLTGRFLDTLAGMHSEDQPGPQRSEDTERRP